MEAANQAILVLQLPRFKFEGRNQQDPEFRRNWPQIARHYAIQGVVDGTSQRPILGDDNQEAVAAWDMLNQLALDKLKYYVTDDVHAIVWKGQDGLTANQYILPENEQPFATDNNEINCETREDFEQQRQETKTETVRVDVQYG